MNRSDTGAAIYMAQALMGGINSINDYFPKAMKMKTFELEILKMCLGKDHVMTKQTETHISRLAKWGEGLTDQARLETEY